LGKEDTQKIGAENTHRRRERERDKEKERKREE